MGATTLSNNRAKTFVARLSGDYPDFKFRAGREEHWSPQSNTITFTLDQNEQQLCFGLLHELAHALLGHANYKGDFELIKLEAQAWELASTIGKKYSIEITEDHIQACLDTYRDWLHRRSTCPTCAMHVLQRDTTTYQCFNCQSIWQVSSGRFVRPYRKTIKIKHV
ncbi:hypothetical protein H0X09_03685 [Candidatus Saccharibacteria bacterium]|nr:hypothetical protein [Candidatus Saccharibacteria bacterium]